MYIIALVYADGRKDWEIIDGEDAMQIRVSELVETGWSVEDIFIGLIID